MYSFLKAFLVLMKKHYEMLINVGRVGNSELAGAIARIF